MTTRFLSILSAGPTATKVKHYEGFPPELTGGTDTRREMGMPAFLVIDDSPDGVFLHRYGVNGEFVGDTWHMDVDEAKAQANYEYEGLAQDWQDVPTEAKDVVAFGVARLKGASSP